MVFTAAIAALVAGTVAGSIITTHVIKRKSSQTDKQSQRLQQTISHTSQLGLITCVSSELAHEVNQPLGAISMYIDTAKLRLQADEIDAREVNQILTSVSQQCHRASRIVQALRKIADQQGSSRNLNKLSELIFALQPIIEMDAEAANVDVNFHIKRKLPPVYCDAAQIQLVILSLTRNAIDEMENASSGEKNLRVEANLAEGNKIRIDVVDHGNGVPEHLRSELFKPYFSTKNHRVGMSLSIAQHIVTAHEGEIGYSQTGHGGSKFWFTIPLSETENL